MIFEQIRIGGDRNFAYLAGDEPGGRAIVFDPSYDPGKAIEIAEKHDLTIEAIAITHDHPDHTNGNDEMKKRTGAPVWMHESAAGEGDRAVKDGETIRVGGLEVRVLHTPGHTPDSVCYLVGDNLVSGDTLFVGKIGGTGFGDDARDEYESLHEKLMKLPGHVEVWPGHDYGEKPSSTIGEERENNPFLKQPDFESFVDLKKNWLQYKKEHGIA